MFEKHFSSLIQEGLIENSKNLLVKINDMEMLYLRKAMYSLYNTGEEQQEDSIQKNKSQCEHCLWTHAK